MVWSGAGRDGRIRRLNALPLIWLAGSGEDLARDKTVRTSGVQLRLDLRTLGLRARARRYFFARSFDTHSGSFTDPPSDAWLQGCGTFTDSSRRSDAISLS